MMIEHKTILSGKSISVLNIQGHVPNGIWMPHRHDYYEVMWSLEDGGSHSIDFEEFPLKKNRLFLISPHQVHDARKLSGQLRVIEFGSDIFELNARNTNTMKALGFDSVFKRPYVDLDQLGAEHLTSLWNLLSLSSHENDLSLSEALLSSYLRFLVRYQVHDSRNGETTNYDHRIEKLESLIENNYKTQKQCEFYANAIGLTPKRINELMRLACGKTVTRRVIERVCLEAKRDLSFSSKPIQTIAAELGYLDSSYFSRLFKTNEGVSPTTYKAKMFK